jgi:hypothetical protein
MKLRVASSAAEMIWQGRVQIGDEPGVYGDASYGGLATELPVTLTQYSGSGVVDVDFDLTAEGASSFGPPYLGHKITVFALTQVPNSNPPVWQKANVGEGTLTSDQATVTASIAPGIRYIGVRVEADVTVTPGFYDDFVLTGLSLRASTHYADFGYRA